MDQGFEHPLADAAIDLGRFVAHLRARAGGPVSHVPGHAMLALGHALVAAGAHGVAHPERVSDWGSLLVRLGFLRVAQDSFHGYVPRAGDIAVLDSPRPGSTGHAQGFDGEAWIGDLVQAGFWPTAAYRRAEPGFEIYRQRPQA